MSSPTGGSRCGTVVHWDTDRARTVELLGPEVVDLVEARPPRRMSLGQIDAVLRRIEDV